MKKIKRFIAGARCPACGEIDKIRCWREDKLIVSECVNCSYRASIEPDGNKAHEEQVIRLTPNE